MPAPVAYRYAFEGGLRPVTSVVLYKADARLRCRNNFVVTVAELTRTSERV
jgi:hypothetical protein